MVSVFRILLTHAALYVGRRKKIKKYFLYILNVFPGFKHRVRFFLHGGDSSRYVHPDIPVEYSQLSSQARTIYNDLRVICSKKELGDK